MNRGRRKRAVYDEEIARTAEIIKSLPIELARELTASQLIRAYAIKLARTTVDPMKDRILASRKDEESMPGTTPRKQRNAAATLERIARIASKTELVLGANEKLSELDAVVMVVRELRSYDAAIIDRNVRRVLPKQQVEVIER